MRIVNLLILSALGLYSGALPAASGDKAATMNQEHDEIFASLEHLKVNFTQAIHTSLRNKTRQRSGTAFFSKPGSFYWQFRDKAKGAVTEEYYFDGKTLSHYVPSEKTVTHYGTKSGLQQELQAVVDLVLNAQKLFSQYEATDTKTVGGVTSLTLKPKSKQKGGGIKVIQVQVAKDPKYVKTVKIEYTNGNYTAFDFTSPDSSPIPASTFRFSNPGSVKENRIG